LTRVLEELKGFPNPDFTKPGEGNRTNQRTNGSAQQARFDCVVVGAGFAGLCLQVVSKVIGIPSVVLERNAEVGDNWVKRYDSARCEVFDYV
jgi:heterodisulfide reductase subunit A-like polyferredoxin